MAGSKPPTPLDHGLTPEEWMTFSWLHDKYERLIAHEDDLLNSRSSFSFTVVAIFLAGLIALVVSGLPAGPKAQGSVGLLGAIVFTGVVWILTIGTGRTIGQHKGVIKNLEALVGQHALPISAAGGVPMTLFRPYSDKPRERTWSPGVSAVLRGIPYVITASATLALAALSLWAFSKGLL